MASWPTYDPNLVDTDFQSVLDQRGAPLLNRATQGLYPPGSTFKIVTAAAALESRQVRRRTPSSRAAVREDAGPAALQRLGRDGARSEQPRRRASCTPTTRRSRRSASSSARSASSSRCRRSASTRRSRSTTRASRWRPAASTGAPGQIADPDRKVDVSRVAIGQAGLLATPLQMAMVTARDRERRRDDGAAARRQRSAARVGPGRGGAGLDEEIGSPISPQTASTLTGIMQRVVDEGTGTAAQIGDLQVAGKTGTAQTGRKDSAGRPLSDAWFVAFAPVSSPKVGHRRRDRGLHRLRRTRSPHPSPATS